ncbi:MAG TPA: hypothetical protein G4O04_06065 [Anaerolineae bacterium]|nr:hypothetical protein [Anaerolineae bacterium]HID83962.1 hypothetical protein [Anaerolineales bacterium]HIQ09722.1 hypothetical protein [Anaerolineaceae bacterium]
MADFIGGVVAFALTVTVLSYLFFGTHRLFRLVVYLFVGVTAGYVGGVAWQSVIWPRAVYPLLFGSDRSLWPVVPLFLAVLLFARLSARWGRVASLSLGFLVGVGAAAAIGGAVLGTLLPQTWATINLPSWRSAADPWVRGELLLSGLVLLVGTVTTLAYFHFGAQGQHKGTPRQSKGLRLLGGLGQIFIATAFGVFFAGVFMAALTALVERVTFLWRFLEALWRHLL